jgi:vitamin B12 transporter
MALFVALRVLAAATVAFSPSPSPTPSAPPQIAHVVTADRSDETLKNSVRTTYVVTAAEIAQNGYRTVTDALASVPGVEIAQSGPIGTYVQYGIRGSTSAQVLVLIDGQPAPGGFADSVDLANISTTGIDRIEVVEGGGSTLYGTGAVGGIINIITNDQKAAPSALLSYGTFDDREFAVSGYGFSFDRTVAQDTYGFPPTTWEPPAAWGDPNNPTTRDNSDYRATTGRFGYDHKLGILDFSAHVTAQSHDLGVFGSLPDDEDPYYGVTESAREHDVNDSAAVGLGLTRAHSAATLSFDASSQQVGYDCSEIVDPLSCFQGGESLSTEVRTGIDLRDVVSGSNERTIYGVDLSRGIVQTNDGEGDPVAVNALAQSAAYVQQTWTGARDEFYAGVRGERDGALGGEFSPSLGFRYDLSGSLYVKANAATAFNAPNASQLYYPLPDSSNPNLQPERSKVGDVTLADDAILGGTAVGWFDNYTHDYIYDDPANNYLPENVDEVHISGLTLDTKTVPLHGVSATLNVTDLYLSNDVDAQSRLADNPVFTVNVGVQYTGGPADFFNGFGVSERAVGQRGPIDYTEPTFFQPIAYSDLTAYATFRLAPKLLLSVRGFNLGNERYAEVAGYPNPGRTLNVELRVK